MIIEGTAFENAFTIEQLDEQGAFVDEQWKVIATMNGHHRFSLYLIYIICDVYPG